MKLGFVSAILPDLSLAEVAGVAAETGFDCVEPGALWADAGRAGRRSGGTPA